MFAALAERVIANLKRALAQRSAATLVVSGGSTPIPLFQLLAARGLDWARVTITLADERWVPVPDPASNEGMVRNTLLAGRASKARLIGLKTPHDDPEAGQSTCALAIASMARPFDTVLLGYGTDGHFASLFPAAPTLMEGLDPNSDRLCLPVRAPGTAQARMSLTLAALRDSREIILLSTGEAKRALLQIALQPGPVEAIPLRALLSLHKPPLTHFWAP